MSRIAPPAVAAAVVCLAFASGCASTKRALGFGPGISRERAIADCVKRIPAQAPLYADRFSACMESHGWVYTAPQD